MTIKKADDHFHIVNEECVPSVWLRMFTHLSSTWIFKRITIQWVIRVITKIMPGNSFELAYQMVALFSKKLYGVADAYIEEAKKANIIISIPLMMDLEYATNDHQPPAIPYTHQVEIMSNISRQHFGVLCPFFGFDPRRKENFKSQGISNGRELPKPLYVKAVEDMGFYGFKFYTKLGVHPWFDSPINSEEVNDALYEFYEYCEEEQIPIVTHCSSGGAYSEALVNNEEARNILCHPTAWIRVLEAFPKLRLMLSHFGWPKESIELMLKYKNVFADLAYNDDAFSDTKEYFKFLNNLPAEVLNKIAWGSDWPMIRHTWTVSQFAKPFEKYIDKHLQQAIFLDNLLAFLFGPSYTIKKEILNALGKTKDDIPKVIAHELKRVKKERVNDGN